MFVFFQAIVPPFFLVHQGPSPKYLWLFRPRGHLGGGGDRFLPRPMQGHLQWNVWFGIPPRIDLLCQGWIGRLKTRLGGGGTPHLSLGGGGGGVLGLPTHPHPSVPFPRNIFFCLSYWDFFLQPTMSCNLCVVCLHLMYVPKPVFCVPNFVSAKTKLS